MPSDAPFLLLYIKTILPDTQCGNRETLISNAKSRRAEIENWVYPTTISGCSKKSPIHRKFFFFFSSISFFCHYLERTGTNISLGYNEKKTISS